MGHERRALVPPELLREGPVALPPEAAKHLAVLRLQPGDPVELIDGQGRRALARMTGAASAEAATPEAAPATEPAVSLTLLFAVPKGDTPDLVIRACTELGVSTFAPVLTQRTIARPKPKRVERWRRIATSAVLQSGRYLLPEILDPTPLPGALAALPERVTRRVAPWVHAQAAPFPAWDGEEADTALLIGPEGGLTEGEAELARQHGFATVSLGPRILRAPTAAIAATALLLTPTSA